MSWSSGLETIVDERVPLGPLTYYGLGGPARWLVRPTSAEQLGEVLRRASREGLTVRTLGRGANLLVSDDGVDGIVLRLDQAELSEIRFDGSRLSAGGGANMMRVVVEAARRGLGGLACMAGIPGTVGGCLRGNAGGRFGEISDCLVNVSVVDRQGTRAELARGEIEFGYRRSSLRDCIVVKAEFDLEPGDREQRRRELRTIWEYKRGTQPLAARSCGCVFKNAPNASAGALIDRAGLKGLTRGRAQISPRHANFIVAHDGATSADVTSLIRFVQERVASEFGVQLELEVEVW